MLKEMLTKWVKSHEPFDPTVFDDPVAAETKWTPARGGGTNFRTRKLVQKNMNRVEFKPTISYIIFTLVFLLTGLGISIGFPVSQLLAGKFELNATIIAPVLFGSIFAIIGGLMFYFASRPVVFDRRAGFFWKGWKLPESSHERTSLTKIAPLEKIYALQIISEHCTSSKSSYYSYELNLVLKNAERINVIDHGNLKKLAEDAKVLGEFLGVPVWNAVGE